MARERESDECTLLVWTTGMPFVTHAGDPQRPEMTLCQIRHFGEQQRQGEWHEVTCPRCHMTPPASRAD
jgi:hypothetical protein